MIGVDLRGKSALITGGTKGIGLASALALAEAGAQVFLTYKWGSADLDKVAAEFEARGALRPGFFEADAAEEKDTVRLMEELAAVSAKIDIFVSNVSFALRTLTLADYKKRSLFKTLEYSTWPLIDYTRKIKEPFRELSEVRPCHLQRRPRPFLPRLRLRGGIEGTSRVLSRGTSPCPSWPRDPVSTCCDSAR